MISTGILLAIVSGIFNGLFTTPMKLIPRWKWENIWLVFILTACLAMPSAMALVLGIDVMAVLDRVPGTVTTIALAFGFAWGFGSILFGLSVDRLGVSIANTLVIGLSSALGALVPLILKGGFHLGAAQVTLLAGVCCFLIGATLCGSAGRTRDRELGVGDSSRTSIAGYLFAIGSGVMSAVFNIGYTLALPIASTAEEMGYSSFSATSIIWILMLGAGSIPNILFCCFLMKQNSSAANFSQGPVSKTWLLSVLMGLLWGGSIYLYGAAAPMLGNLGPAIGWPLSLAAAVVVANLMGIFLKEWSGASPLSKGRMRNGLAILLLAILLCAGSSQVS